MQTRMERFLREQRRILGPVLFAAAFLVYCATLSPYAFPGEPAHLIAQHLGLYPFPPMSHPLWTWIVKIAAAVPLGGLVIRLNLLSALFGAGAVWLMYEIMSGVHHDRTAEEVESRYPEAPVQTLTGLVAALFLAFCVPFWVVSTRAHVASFDVFFFLLAVLVLVRFDEIRDLRLACLFAFLYGLGTTEFATMIVLGPIFGFRLLFSMWRGGLLRAGPVALVVLCGVLGLSPYFMEALQYRLSPAFAWRDFTSYGQVLWYIWRDQYRTIRFSLPQVGWLMVFLVSALPWIIVLGFAKRAMTRSAVAGSNFLHALLTVLGILILLNVPIAPWPLLKMKPLLVMPYVLTAAWFGYLAGYWYIFFAQRSRFEPRPSAMLKGMGYAVYGPLLAVLMVSGLALNWRVANGRVSGPIREFTEEVLDQVGDRPWLISNGWVDDLVALLARERKIPVKQLDVSQAASESYMRYVASLFEDLRLRGLAELGLQPLVNEWFSEHPDVVDRVAVLSWPDLWYAAGRTPVPESVLFGGADDVEMLNAEQLFEKHRAFWSSCGETLKRATKKETLASPWDHWALTHVSRVANNAGVTLEDLGRSDLAFKAYEAARQMDTNNLSALLNMLSLAQRDDLPEKSELEKEFSDFARRFRGQLPLWSLASFYGYVRDPEAFARRGWAWAMSGKPSIGIREMQKAVALGADKQRASLAMASFYLLMKEDVEGERMYKQVLDEDPQNREALLGLARVAMRAGDFDTARTYLARLKEAGALASLTAAEEAIMNMALGDLDGARDVLLAVTADNPKDVRLWSLLLLVAGLQNDKDLVDRCYAVLAPAAADSPMVLLALAQAAIMSRNYEDARRFLDEALRLQSRNQQAIELLLQLDIAETDRNRAEEHLAQLLAIDPRNAFGNYVLGTFQYARAEYEQAETSYRISLASRKTAKVLNDLAWILQVRGRSDEALPMVREALEINERYGPAWDTLGIVSMSLGDLEEAERALQQALSLQPDNPYSILHMAQLYEHRGMHKEALRLADPLLARATDMSPDAYDELRGLIKRLRSQRSRG